MPVKKQELEPYMEQLTGSELGKEYDSLYTATCLFNLHEECVHAKSLQSCSTLCDPMDCSLEASSIHGILQARILEWVAMPFPRDLLNLGIKSASLASPPLADGFFTTSAI